jgi:hypothetical protein
MYKLTLILFCIYYLFVGRALAQIDSGTGHPPSALEINVGTQGIGADYGYGIFSRLAVRLGADIIPLSAKNLFNVSGFNSTSKARANFQNVHLLVDIMPFKNHSGLRFVGGMAYFFKANGDINLQPSDEYSYGDIKLTPDQVGQININVDWNGVAPYMGIGLARLFPSRLFNVNLDVGTYYLSRPNATITGTGILEGNGSQTGQLNDNLKNYKWLPVLQLNFNFKL